MKRLDELFDLRYGHSLELNALDRAEAPDGVNFVSRAMGNNGVTARVLTTATPAHPGEISVALGGNGVLSSFVQPEPFVCGRDVMILTPRNVRMGLVERLWWCQCIWENRSRFSYGRQANRTLAALPVPDSPPSWISEIEVPNMDGLLVPLIRTDPHIDPERWSDFRAGEIFNINSGKYVPTRDKKPGRTPEVTSSATNNGVSRFLDLPANFPGGSISVARNGSVGTAFYQPVPFFATDDVRVWTAMKGALSVWEALFVCAVIELEQPRYSYGRKWSLDQMRATNLRLPATDGGQPDWGLMADTIMGLKFSRALVD